MISVDNVSIRFGSFVLFDGISFQVNPGERIGLVGRNGAGKTTLLNLIASKQEPDEGKVVITAGKTVGYLPQQMKHRKGRTLYLETLDAFSEILELKHRIDSLARELEERTDHESASYLALIQELSNANERFEMEGGRSMQSEVEQTLTGLGFDKKDMNRPVHEFSGGWRMRDLISSCSMSPPITWTSSPYSGWRTFLATTPEGS
jgi:ATP-binding cassette subfamily F protein 3